MQFLLHKEFLEKHSGTPVSVQFLAPRIAYHFVTVPEFKDEYEQSDNLMLKDEKDDAVATAILFTPYSSRHNHSAVHNIPWTVLNNNPDLWGYRIKEVSKQEANDVFMLSEEEEEEEAYDSDGYGPVSEQRRWRVDVEINIKRYNYNFPVKENNHGLITVY